eukprot:3727146-Alexandrium_andersonii.AAC.1
MSRLLCVPTCAPHASRQAYAVRTCPGISCRTPCCCTRCSPRSRAAPLLSGRACAPPTHCATLAFVREGCARAP